MSAAQHSSAGFDWQQGWRYGLMGLPLAFVALPLYVLLPNHYARSFGVPLAALGALLLGTRLFDALIDPLLGRLSDRLFARSPRAVLGAAGLAALLLALGFVLLFFPPLRSSDELLLWAGASLLLTYAAFSALSVMHQSWGAMLGGDEVQRSRIVAWREGLGLAGVILASITPSVLGLPATTAIFVLALVLAWLAWSSARPPQTAPGGEAALPNQASSLWLPFSRPAFRALLLVFIAGALLAGGIANSGDRGRFEGAYFGWWNFASKLNLALAAGLALPALGALGYVPGSRDAQALDMLSAAYCLLPCALKLLAATLLYTLIIRRNP
ncbi:MAG: hypothetical protein EB007_04095 [Betaproteobacteria bacterium]|nr:hypothetical protein [Betaproteobacteria bacterium]